MTPPTHLSERSQSIWQEIVPRAAKSPERRVLLQTALELLDRLDSCRRELDAAGSLTTKTLTTGAVHIHPVLKTEFELRKQFAAIWSQLGLSVDPYSFKVQP